MINQFISQFNNAGTVGLVLGFASLVVTLTLIHLVKAHIDHQRARIWAKEFKKYYKGDREHEHD